MKGFYLSPLKVYIEPLTYFSDFSRLVFPMRAVFLRTFLTNFDFNS